MDNTEKSTAILSLCPGILGLERGIERALSKCRTVAYVEIESFIISNLVAQMESGLLDPAPIWSNVKTFDARPFRNKVHGIIGGYPCQPFSNTGHRKGTDDPRHLWPYIQQHINIIRPVFCFFENVSGHITLGYGEVYRSLRDMGYSVEAGIFTAEEIGAPHERKRLFILAVCSQLEHTASWWDGRFRQPIETGEGYGIIGGGSNTRIAEGVAQGDTLSKRLEGHAGYDSTEIRREVEKRPTTETGIFPAGQGSFQHEWEESRAIESSMVYTIDGYNFTEDLHRAIGNSVVEQTAELAFITLLKKHLKNMD